MKQHTSHADRARHGLGGPRALAAIPVLAVTVLLLLVALAPSAQAASKYARTIRDGRAAARALLAQTGAASLSLALVSDGRIVWRQSFGYADVDARRPATATTRYGIGSVSKTVAAVAIMRLVDDGLVDLDEPVVTYLPGFRMASPGYREVTVRMLLDHSSGLPGTAYGSLMAYEYWPGYLDQVIGTLGTSRLKHTPGALSVYCNDGFTLLEAIVAAVTGDPFAEYVQREVFAPLGMTHSAYPLVPLAEGTYAKAYDADGTVHPQEVVNTLASGGLYSTPGDMARFGTMLMSRGAYNGRRILSPAAVREMGSDQTVGELTVADFDAGRYGLGWDSVTQPGLKKAGFTTWMKGGDSSDYHAGFMVVPRQRLAVMVEGVAPINSTLAETLCERILLHALVDRGALRRVPAPLPDVMPPVKTATAAQLRALKGYWAGNDLLFKLDTGAVSQSVDIQMLGSDGAWHETATGLRLRTDGTFRHKGSPNGVWVSSTAGRRYLVDRMVSGNGFYRDDMPLAQKLTAKQPLSAAWTARLGHLWVGVNEHPASMFWYAGGPLLRVSDVPGLPGYVVATTGGYGKQIVDAGESDEVGFMFLQIPGFGSRDENDLVVEDRGGEEWMRYGSTLYRPLDTIPALLEGDNVVITDGGGDAEWRVLTTASQVTVDAGLRWRLYDEDLNVVDEGTGYPAQIDAGAPGYLCLFAQAGASTTVHVTPVAGAAPRRLHAPRLPHSTPSLEDVTAPER